MSSFALLNAAFAVSCEYFFTLSLYSTSRASAATVPALIIVPVSSPVVIKFATICPSAVIAVVNVPFTPVLLCPSPARFQRHTFFASLMFSLSRIIISCGFCDGYNTTCPPLFPVIASVTFLIVFSISAFIFSVRVWFLMISSLASFSTAVILFVRFVRVSPISRLSYLSFMLSYFTFVILAFAEIPSGKIFTVTVSHSLTFSNACRFL